MTFPYTGWVLLSSYKPKQEKFVDIDGGDDYHAEWHITDKGKYLHVEEIYASKQDAISAGVRMLKTQQAVVDKAQSSIHKRREELEKAAGESKP